MQETFFLLYLTVFWMPSLEEAIKVSISWMICDYLLTSCFVSNFVIGLRVLQSPTSIYILDCNRWKILQRRRVVVAANSI